MTADSYVMVSREALEQLAQRDDSIGDDVRAMLAAAPSAPTREDGEVERFWLIVHEPGCVPERKGSWPTRQLARVMREFITARPRAYLTVLTIGPDGTPDVQHGPEALQMADGRSMSVGSRHNRWTREAHAAFHAALPPRTPSREEIAAELLQAIHDAMADECDGEQDGDIIVKGCEAAGYCDPESAADAFKDAAVQAILPLITGDQG